MASNVTRDHHNLRRNLKLNGKYISNDGGDEGIRITDDGLVGIGVDDPDTTLEIYKVGTQLKLSGGASDYATFAVAADGALTITTTDADAQEGEINLVADGHISLDSYGSTSIAEASSEPITMTPGTSVIIDKNLSETTASDIKGLHVDVDRTGTVSTGTDTSIGIDLDVNHTGASGGTISTKGLDVDVVGDTGGSSFAYGIDITTSGSDYQYGLSITTDDGSPGESIVLRSSGNVLDRFSIDTVGDGETTLTTFENGGGSTAHLNMVADGNFTVDAVGDISLDSATGVFEMKGAGTTAKFADMYAGMILGYTAIGIHGADASYAVTASFAVTDSDHKVTFIAPPSGKVEIEVSIYGNSSSVRQLFFGLSDNATYANINFPSVLAASTNEHIIADMQIEGLPKEFIHKWVVEGLTAGDEYEWWLGAKAEQAGRNTLYWGGDAVDEYAPFIMKATALPSTIYTG